MHINYIGISGGKDSTALLLWAVHESGYPRESLRVTFCDTGNEAEETYEYVRMLSETVHPVHWIKPPLDFYELAEKRGRFPSPKVRFCTQELKMKPTKADIDALLAAGHTVLAHSGVRAAESADRARMEEREPAWLSYFGVETYRPLLRWSLADVWAIHDRYGVPRNPLYAMGCSRVGCVPCIMSRKSELLNIARRMPGRIDLIRRRERTAGEHYTTFFGRKMVPLRYRTCTVTTARGERIAVASVDDVVRWAEADAFATIPMDFEDLEEPPTCDSRSGLCE